MSVEVANWQQIAEAERALRLAMEHLHSAKWQNGSEGDAFDATAPREAEAAVEAAEQALRALGVEPWPDRAGVAPQGDGR